MKNPIIKIPINNPIIMKKEKKKGNKGREEMNEVKNGNPLNTQ